MIHHSIQIVFNPQGNRLITASKFRNVQIEERSLLSTIQVRIKLLVFGIQQQVNVNKSLKDIPMKSSVVLSITKEILLLQV